MAKRWQPERPNAKQSKPNYAANQFRCAKCSKRFSKSSQLTRHFLLTGHTKRPGT